MDQKSKERREILTTPRAAAIAGIIFSLLFLISIVLIRISVPQDPLDSGSWLLENSKRVALALNIVPFAGIAFLWFIGVIRDRIGEYEDRFFATVFLGSGLLFLAMLFVSAATGGGLITVYEVNTGTPLDLSTYNFGRSTTYMIANVYAMKMAGVFMMVTCTLALRTGIFKRWMAFLGIALALLLLLSVGYLYWVILVFPLWVLLISIHILLSNIGDTENEPAKDSEADQAT